jgi:cobalt-zinc-cadmium efflux system protein
MLNLCFAALEFIGGIITGSVAIMSDSLHDMGDAAGIGISYLLERKSNHAPDEKFTLGYARFSVLGGGFLNLSLVIGSVAVICNAVLRIINPTPVHHDRMILLAVLGIAINSLAAHFTHKSESLNQKAVGLHLLEDILGQITILVGAIAIRLTGFTIIDPLISIGTAIFILIHSAKNLCMALDIFLEKAPESINITDLKESLLAIPGISEILRIQIWTTDGKTHCATLHIIASEKRGEPKQKIRKLLSEYGIENITIEIDRAQTQ